MSDTVVDINLALAYAEQSENWTADRRLWNAVNRELNWVRWLDEYQPDRC
jgi:hypothetical protein